MRVSHIRMPRARGTPQLPPKNTEPQGTSRKVGTLGRPSHSQPRGAHTIFAPRGKHTQKSCNTLWRPYE